MVHSAVEGGAIEAAEGGEQDDSGGDHANEANKGGEIAGKSVGGRHLSLFD